MSAGQEKERRKNGKEGVGCVGREQYGTKGDGRKIRSLQGVGAFLIVWFEGVLVGWFWFLLNLLLVVN